MDIVGAKQLNVAKHLNCNSDAQVATSHLFDQPTPGKKGDGMQQTSTAEQ